jgi:hypothetical protein
MGFDGGADHPTKRVEKGTLIDREAESRATLHCEDAERRWLLWGENEDMHPIDRSLSAENIQRRFVVGELDELNTSIGRRDLQGGIRAIRLARRWRVPVGPPSAGNDNPRVRGELQNVAMLDVESADYERRDRRQLRINTAGDGSLQQLGSLSARLQSSFIPLRFEVAETLEPARTGQRSPRRLSGRSRKHARTG